VGRERDGSSRRTSSSISSAMWSSERCAGDLLSASSASSESILSCLYCSCVMQFCSWLFYKSKTHKRVRVRPGQEQKHVIKAACPTHLQRALRCIECGALGIHKHIES